MLENNAYTKKCVYICESKHITSISYATSARIVPNEANCRKCHKPATIAGYPQGTRPSIPEKEVNDSSDVTNEIVEDTTSKGTHLEALYERRTEEELETLLNHYLSELRAKPNYETLLQNV